MRTGIIGLESQLNRQGHGCHERKSTANKRKASLETRNNHRTGTQVGTLPEFFSQTHRVAALLLAGVVEYRLPKVAATHVILFGDALPTAQVAAFGLVVKRE